MVMFGVQHTDETGKVKGSDIREAKQTILYAYTYNSGYKDELMKYYGKETLFCLWYLAKW